MSDLDPTNGSADNEQWLDDADDLTTLLREMTDNDRHRTEPPPSIWNAISDTVTADRDGRPDRTLTIADNGNGSVVSDISPIERQATATITLARRQPPDQSVFPTETSAWRRQWLPVAAAVAVTIVGGLVTWAFSDELPGADGEVVAVAEITDEGVTAGFGGQGEARLVQIGDGYALDLDVPELPEVDGYFELWIADSTFEGVVSLGPISGDGRYSLPANLDPVAYPVVDVSVELIDGDPTHSERSAWRGELDL